MPSFSISKIAGADASDHSPGERYTRALVKLTQQVWHPDCTFDTAVGLICETAAEALRVERVNVWRYDEQKNTLQGIHAYRRSDGCHESAEALESLLLDGNYYTVPLQEVRAIDAADVESDPTTAESVGELRHYLRRHRIHALLDAPIRIEGELFGVICHENVDFPRQWTREEATFAGSMGDYVAMAYEIARRHEAESQIQHLLLHDATTDLPNRDYMVELLDQRLAVPRSRGRAFAVVHVRIDAEHGTALSPDAPTLEDVMAEVALRLRRFANGDVSLGRVRADAFALLVSRSAGDADAIRLAERVIATVGAIPRLHEDIDPAAAVGIAFADFSDTDSRVLLRKAEQAADRARAQGRHRFEVFDLEHHHELVERLRMMRALRDAFAQDRFELHYQPEFDLQRGGWSSAEALLRWRTDERLVVASEFITAAEASELILPLGHWVLEQACRDAAAWPMNGGTPPVVRVNVSARQFDADGGLVAAVAAALDKAHLPGERLCLELTETTLMRDIDRTQSILNELKSLGVQIAIDDFGTGYSSLVYLKRFPIDTLKIDRSFVQDLPQDTADGAIVSAVFGLAESMDIEVVAEGVERLEQQHALQDIGVTRMQGWLYAKAMEQRKLCALFDTASA